MSNLRGVWIAACVIGIVACVGVGALASLALFDLRDDPDAQIGSMVNMLLFAVGVGAACIAGLFLGPKQIERVIQEGEPPGHRAAWLDRVDEDPR